MEEINKHKILKIISSGLTSSLRSNIVVSDLEEQEANYHLLYHSTFFKVDDALKIYSIQYDEPISTLYIQLQPKK